MSTGRHDVVIVGGGTAGISVAARLRRAGVADVAVVEPADLHYYQPLWTLVGAGQAETRETVLPEATVMPSGVTWIHDRATGIDPDAHTVTLGDGSTVGFEQLVLAPGIQLNFDAVPGLAETLGRDGVSSNYAAGVAGALARRRRRPAAQRATPQIEITGHVPPSSAARPSADHHGVPS